MLIQLTPTKLYNAINGDIISFDREYKLDDGSTVPLLEFDMFSETERFIKGEDATQAWAQLLKVAEMDKVDALFSYEQTLDAAEQYNNPPEEPDF